MTRVSQIVARTEPRKVTLVLAGGLLLLAVAVWQFHLHAQVKSYRALVSERGQSAQNVERERAGLGGGVLESTRAEVSRLENELYGDGPAVPVSQMASHVIGLLDGLAGQHSVTLAGVRPGPTAQVLGFVEVPFDVAVRGRYADLIAWLQAGEQALRPLVVKQFRIQPTERGGALEMTLRVVSYRAPRVGT